jgi:hypothetical protein
MARDTQTQTIFTTADDQMQGLWGLHHYLVAATDLIKPNELLRHLPREAFPLTHEWRRLYNPKEMVDEVCQMREFLICRQSLVALVTITEVALQRLNNRLFDLKALTKSRNLLAWAFKVVRKSPLGSAQALQRLPSTCGDLDNARRLRNCIVHNNGCYNVDMYINQAINDEWISVKFDKGSDAAAAANEPIFLVYEQFERLSRSHIEFLHILHNTIQQNEFGHSEPYNYATERKRIEWRLILSGGRDVKM